jgi:hypothetical protein
MFGVDHPSSPEASSSSIEAGATPTPADSVPASMPSAVEGTAPSSAEPDEVPDLRDSAVPDVSPIPEINRGQQGLRFKMLPKWEQQWLLRVHKNLGHPSNDRLVKALQMQGAHPGLVQAAQELACQICKSQEPPKSARPARLKPMLDFNHRIYLDGIDWTNSQGKTYHMYHILDAGSNYHVAVAAPAKSTESLIEIINKNWISWAGPPSELFIDAGTEMNSAAFEQFTSRF